MGLAGWVRRSHRSAVAVVALVGVLGAITACTVPPPPPPPPTGTLSGTITGDDTGLPVSGVLVKVHTLSSPGPYTDRETTTAADGTYSITVPSGSSNPHQIEFEDPAGVYASEFYNSNYNSYTQTVTVADGGNTVINAGLAVRGKIAGRVTDQGSFAGVGSLVVEALAGQGGATEASTVTAADGSYLLSGLPMGPHYLRVSDPGGSYPTELYDNATVLADASTTFNAPGTTTTVDISVGTAWPPGCTPAPGANLAGCDFTRGDLSNLDVHGANFAGAILTRARITGTNLSSTTGLTPAQLTAVNTNWRGIDLHGSDVDLSGVNLYGRRVAGGDLRGLHLVGTRFGYNELDHVDLRGADLTNADFMNYTPAPPPGGCTFFCSPSVPFCSALASMAGTHLAGATLVNVKMAQRQVEASDPDWRGAQVSFFVLGGCYESFDFGPFLDVDLRNFDFPAHAFQLAGTSFGGSPLLTNANFAGMDLTGFGCAGCQLSGAHFGGATLTNASFLNATGPPDGASTAVHNNTVCPDAVIAGGGGAPTCVGHGFNP